MSRSKYIFMCRVCDLVRQETYVWNIPHTWKCTVSRWASPRLDNVELILLSSGNPIKCHEEVSSLQPMIPPNLNVLTFFPLTGGCSEGLYAFRFFYKHDKPPVAIPREKSGKVCSWWVPITSTKGRHTGRLWSMILSAPLRIVVLCFSVLLTLERTL